jgi:hypothetical protein
MGWQPAAFWGATLWEWAAAARARQAEDKRHRYLQGWLTANVVNCWAKKPITDIPQWMDVPEKAKPKVVTADEAHEMRAALAERARSFAGVDLTEPDTYPAWYDKDGRGNG